MSVFYIDRSQGDVVTALEELLEEARAGKIKSFHLVGQWHNGYVIRAQVGEGDRIQALGNLHYLAARITRGLIEDDDHGPGGLEDD